MGFPVFPLSWGSSVGYKEAGYFPEAVVNFLAMLGWNSGDDKELYTLKELINAFTLERVHNSGARFDPDKTKWYNHQYLQQKSDEELAALFYPIVQEKKVTLEQQLNLEYVTRVVSMVKERADFVNDLWELSSYFFEAPGYYEEKAVKKQWKENTPSILANLQKVLENAPSFESANVESVIKEWIVAEGLSFGMVMAPLRLVIVGDLKGPHLFDIISLIGKEESVKRIQIAIERLK
jgi:glutamyl-tRNA synthetase